MRFLRAFLAAWLLLTAPYQAAVAADIGVSSWSETDNGNNATPPAGWPTGMNPSAVEPTARAMMGALKRFWNRANAVVSTTGTAPHYVYTPANAAYPASYAQGEIYCFKANFASAGSDDLNINSLGALPVYKANGSGFAAIAAGDLQPAHMSCVAYDAALNSGGGGFQLLLGPATGSAGLGSNNAWTGSNTYQGGATFNGAASFSGTTGFGATTTVPTPAFGDNSTNAATTAFVRRAVNVLRVLVLTGQSNSQGTNANPALSPSIPPGYAFQYYGSTFSALTGDPVGNAIPSSAWPEFIITWLAAHPGEGVLVVPAAVGGTDACATTGISSNGNWSASGTLAPAAVAAVTAGMAAARAAGYTPIYSGDIHMQGENDFGALGTNPVVQPGGVTTVTGGSYAAGTTSITVSSATGIGTTNRAVLTLDNSTTYTTAIANVVGTTLTLVTGIPAGRALNNGAGLHIYAKADYENCLLGTINYFRTATTDGTTFPTLPVFIVQTGAPGGGDNLGAQETRQAQDEVAQNDPYTKVVDRRAIDAVGQGLMQGATTITASIDNGSGGSGTVLTVSAVAQTTTPLTIGAAITNSGGAAVSANTMITGFGTGTGGPGKYTVNNAQSVSSETMIATVSNLHELGEAYNAMGREIAKAIISAEQTEGWLHPPYPVARVQLGGTLRTSDQLTITLTSAAISGSPLTLGPATVSSTSSFCPVGDVMQLNASIFSPSLAALGITLSVTNCSATGALLTIAWPPSLQQPPTVTAAWITGGATETQFVMTGGSAGGWAPDLYYNKGNLTIGGLGTLGPDLFDVMGPSSGPLLALGSNTFPSGFINSVASGSDNIVARFGNSVAADNTDQRVSLLLQPDMRLFYEGLGLCGAFIEAKHENAGQGGADIRFGGYRCVSPGKTIYGTFFESGGFGVGVSSDPGAGNAAINGTLQADGITYPTSVTSGGVVYASSTSQLGSSALLAANGPMIGGGAGAAPATVTAGSNGQLFLGVTSAAPQFATMSGDATITNAGVLSVNHLTHVTDASLANSGLAHSTISGVALGSNLGTLTFGTHLAAGGASYNGSAGVTITSDATNANTASTIVARDASGNFSAGAITGTSGILGNIYGGSAAGNALNLFSTSSGSPAGDQITVEATTVILRNWTNGTNLTLNGSGLSVNSTVAVSCSGALTGSAVVTDGLVTHC